ncbi:type II secretion system protein [Planctomicrobium sp. SH668]|uniref:type II secretion system protein n=1 Tax=Planctomicrobium sp. SH668 TaxID=3448126 RepID=UPI003F5AF41F
MRNSTPHMKHFSRSGFTLIELLVVMAIIGVLATIGITAGMSAMEGAKVAATKTTIAQLNRMIQERMDGFLELDLKNDAKKFRSAYNAGGNSNPVPTQINDELAEIILRRRYYMNFFPQNAHDLYGFAETYTSGGADVTDIRDAWNNATGSGTHAEETESSELLYIFLSSSRKFGREVANIDEINPKHIADTDGDGRLEFVDAWGKPLRFYNAPTRLIKDTTGIREAMFQGLPADLTIDPLDPIGRISLGSNIGLFSAPFRLRINNAMVNAEHLGADFYFDPETYFAFLLVSSGPDSKLGLGEPTLEHNPNRLGHVLSGDEASDNITNRQQ